MKKAAATSTTGECANCGKPGGIGVTLAKCGRCQLVAYCSRDCQAAHWKRKLGGHKEVCISVADRRPSPTSQPTSSVPDDQEDKCTICLEALASAPLCTLPCKHAFHAPCIARMRALSGLQACPLCRGSLPPSTEAFIPILYEFLRFHAFVEDRGKSWNKLGGETRRKMDSFAVRIRKLADQGVPLAIQLYGNLIREGKGFPVNNKKALAWFRKGADLGYAPSMGNVALMLKNGLGAPQNTPEAITWLRKCADTGDAKAFFNLALIYQNGEGVPVAMNQAVHCWRQAAELGDAEAMANLGELLMVAVGGVAHVPVEALKWFQASAAKHHRKGSVGLAVAYEHGVDWRGQRHLAADQAQAARLYSAALRQGPDEHGIAAVGLSRTRAAVSARARAAVASPRKPAPQPAPAVATSRKSDSDADPVGIGARVVLHGLVTKTSLNRCRGKVVGWVEAKGRFLVELDDDKGTYSFLPAFVRVAK